MDEKIASLRQEYSHKQLLESSIEPDPIQQFAMWWQEALDSKIVEANAMTLATASQDGFPSARIVLLKGFSEAGFVFYTNYNSFKAMQLAENPKACLVFFWKELERQVRITGIVERTSEEDSETYFHSRPEGSRLGAVASPQSQVIENRQWLDDHYQTILKQMQGKSIDRPAHWGGFIVKPVIIEFWQGRPSRMHDRIQYTVLESGEWKIERLAP